MSLWVWVTRCSLENLAGFLVSTTTGNMAQQPFDVLRKRVPAPCHMLIGADEKKVALVETEQVRATEPHGFKRHACRARRSLDRAAVDIVDREQREEQAKLDRKSTRLNSSH